MAPAAAMHVECAVSAGTVSARGRREAARRCRGHLVQNGVASRPTAVRCSSGRALRRAPHVRRVRDTTGVGIPAHRLEQLLERQSPMRDSSHHHSSNTLEFNSGGLGLGLSIARGIARTAAGCAPRAAGRAARSLSHPARAGGTGAGSPPDGGALAHASILRTLAALALLTLSRPAPRAPTRRSACACAGCSISRFAQRQPRRRARASTRSPPTRNRAESACGCSPRAPRRRTSTCSRRR